jgi:cytochrome c oxidase assembly factor CtaG
VSAPAATSFSFEPLFLVLAVAAAVLYVRAMRGRLRSWRAFSFGVGLLLVVAPLDSPLETIAVHYLLLAHLLQNAIVADWAPPLLIIGLPQDLRAAVARRGGRPFAWATRPVVALPIWLAAWYGVHLPVFYDFALRHGWPLNLEHAILLGAGLLFWWTILAGVPHRVPTTAALGYLGIAFATSVFLGLAFMFSSSPFYSFYRHAPRLWGLSPAQDQNYGGVLMNGEQTLVFLIALGYFFNRLLDEEHARGDTDVPTIQPRASREGRTHTTQPR